MAQPEQSETPVKTTGKVDARVFNVSPPTPTTTQREERRRELTELERAENEEFDKNAQKSRESLERARSPGGRSLRDKDDEEIEFDISHVSDSTRNRNELRKSLHSTEEFERVAFESTVQKKLE